MIPKLFFSQILQIWNDPEGCWSEISLHEVRFHYQETYTESDVILTVHRR